MDEKDLLDRIQEMHLALERLREAPQGSKVCEACLDVKLPPHPWCYCQCDD